MKDRISGKPGRVLITPENGAAPYYAVMTRADEPEQEGTPLNKATLQADETAALFGLDGNAVPNDLFAWLGKYNLHWWKRRPNIATLPFTVGEPLTIEAGSVSDYFAHEYYENAKLIKMSSTSASTTVTITYSDSIEVLEDGTLALVDPQTFTITISEYSDALSAILGKYYSSSAGDGKIRFAPTDTTFFRSGNSDNGYAVFIKTWCEVYPPDFPEWDTYLQAANGEEYPHSGMLGEYEYRYLGIPFVNAANSTKIATGEYVGTGDCGSEDAKITLTFDFHPLLVFVGKVGSVYGGYPWVRGMKTGMTTGYGVKYSNSHTTAVLIWGDNAISWYSSQGVSNGGDVRQLNEAGETYRYVAIGI